MTNKRQKYWHTWNGAPEETSQWTPEEVQQKTKHETRDKHESHLRPYREGFHHQLQQLYRNCWLDRLPQHCPRPPPPPNSIISKRSSDMVGCWLLRWTTADPHSARKHVELMALPVLSQTQSDLFLSLTLSPPAYQFRNPEHLNVPTCMYSFMMIKALPINVQIMTSRMNAIISKIYMMRTQCLTTLCVNMYEVAHLACKRVVLQLLQHAVSQRRHKQHN